MDPFQPATEALIRQWFAITPPNDPARRLTSELEETIKAFEGLRGTIVFEDEPSSFEAALQATKETAV